MKYNQRIAGLILLTVIIGACGPDTLVLRPSLDTPVQHVKNGNCLLERGKIDAARSEFMRAKSLDAGYAPAYVGIALVQGAQGNVADGIKTLNQARALAVSEEEVAAVDHGFERLRRMQSRPQD